MRLNLRINDLDVGVGDFVLGNIVGRAEFFGDDGKNRTLAVWKVEALSRGFHIVGFAAAGRADRCGTDFYYRHEWWLTEAPDCQEETDNASEHSPTT